MPELGMSLMLKNQQYVLNYVALDRNTQETELRMIT